MKYILLLLVLLYGGKQCCATSDSLTISAVITQQRCGGDGAISLSAQGGTSPYYYQWGQGGYNNFVSPVLSQLGTGSYSVTVIDAAGNYAFGNYTINNYQSYYLYNYNSLQSGCNNHSGVLQLFPGGGTPPYTYLWSNGATNDSLTGLAAGNYHFSITDSLGCVDTGTVVVYRDTILYPNINTDNASCGHNNGDASVYFYYGSGAPPYTYSWSNGAATAYDSSLASGTYRLTITDNSGCTTIDSVVIENQPGLNLANYNYTNAYCNDDSTGSITLYPAGGIEPYFYRWSNGDTDSIAQNLSVGTYYVSVHDRNGCAATDTISISSSNQLNVTSNIIQPATSCSSGSITFLVDGGVGPYAYLWNNNLAYGYGTDSSWTVIAGDSLQSILGGGCYQISITDTGGCSGYYQFYDNNSFGSYFGVTVTPQIFTCGLANGSATATPFYGTWCNLPGAIRYHAMQPLAAHAHDGFSYLWSNGDTTQTISGLVSGTYYITVTDSVGCTTNDSVYIFNFNSISMYSIFENPVCRLGAIAVAGYGGQAPYSYQWNSSDTANTITNIGPGTYTVNVKDVNGCSVSQSFTSNFPANYGIGEILNTGTPAHCGLPNGTLIIGSYPNGYNGYNYGYLPTLQWSNGATSNFGYNYNTGLYQSYLGSLAAGAYSVTATDVYGCTATAAAYVDSVPGLAITGFYTTNAACRDSNGTITVSPSEGTAPYSFHWSNNQTSQTDTALAAGAYTVTVNDYNGCSASGTIAISIYSNLAVAVNTVNPTCGRADGSIATLITQGTPPYIYSWSNHEAGATDTGLIAGSYTVTINDDKGCTGTTGATIVGGNISPTITIGLLTPTHCREANGSVCAIANSSAYPDTMLFHYYYNNGNLDSDYYYTNTSYEYHWSAWPAGDSVLTYGCLDSVVAGTYTVTATDPSGCTASASVIISNIDTTGLALGFSEIHPGCDISNGSITVTASNGTSPYTYLWNNHQTAQTITGLVAGVYSVTAKDINGCSASGTDNLTGGNVSPRITVESINEEHCGLLNGSAIVVVSDSAYAGTSLLYHWSNGELSANLENVDTGTYTLIATDPSGCTGTGSVTINGTQHPTLNIDVINPCVNTPGTITVIPSGGVFPFTYTWQNHDTTAMVTGIAGPYYVTVTDNSGCSVTDTINLETQTVDTTAITVTTIPGDSITFGTQVVFTAHAVNGGTVPVYQWIKNGHTVVGSNSPTYTDIALMNGDVISCVMTTNLSCAFPLADSSSPIIMYVYVIPTVSIVANQLDTIITEGGGENNNNGPNYQGGGNILGSGTAGGWGNGGIFDPGNINTPPTEQICQGASVTFTATPTYGGSAPSYQWYLNDDEVGDDEPTYTTDVLSEGDEVYVEMTSNAVNANPAVVQSTPITIKVNTPSYSITSATICQGDSFILGGNVYTEEGYYTIDGFTSAIGCDSMAILELTVNQPSTSMLVTYVCDAQSYSFHGHTYDSAGTYIIDGLTNADGCDSTITLYLIFNQPISDTINVGICSGQSYSYNGHTYNTAGNYNAVYTSIGGCDSIVTLSLSVLPYLSNYISARICAGSSYNFNGRMLNAPGIYKDTTTSVGGCDSIITLNLSVYPVIARVMNVGICPGSIYIFNGQFLTSTGTYIDTFTTFAGCDSIVTLNLTLREQLRDTFTAAICPGDSFSFNGHHSAMAGFYTDTFYAIGGCDSIVSLRLTVLPVIQTTINKSICQGQVYDGHGQSGMYVDTFSAANSCDSIRTLHLTVSTTIQTTISQAICVGDSLYGFNQTGTYIDTFTAIGGCDSIRTLNLAILPLAISSVTQTICQGQAYGGHTATGTYIDTFAAANSCDSIRTLILTVSASITTNITKNICMGQIYEGYNSTGIYVDSFTAVGGCDSVRTLQLTVNRVFNDTLSYAVCQGDTFNGHTATGIYTDSLISSGGCDSIVTLNLLVNPLPAQPAISRNNDTLISEIAWAYQWYRNSLILAGDTNRILVVTQNGNYYVEVRDSEECSNNSLTINFVNVGIAEINSTSRVSVSPNPTSGPVYVLIGDVAENEPVYIKVFDIIGQEVLTQSQSTFGGKYSAQFDMAGFADGIYMLQIMQSNWRYSQKIILAR